MDSNDLVQIIINISQSMGSLQRLFTGMAYVVGIVFIFAGISKLHSQINAGKHSRGSEHSFPAIAYLIGGSALIFLPSTFHAVSLTVFGSDNVLQYASQKPVDVTTAMILVIRTVGLAWFIQGCVLVVGSSEPGTQEGPKGMAFLCAGILAMNFEASAATVSAIIEKFLEFTMSIKNTLGF
jgi:hypothetical protein